MRNPQNSDKKVIRTARPLILVGLLILFFVQVSAQNGTVNFSGTWALNESKSKFGDGPFRMAASTLIVKQDGNNLSVERTMNGPDGQEMKMTAKYTLDGKECENSGMMDMKTKSTVTWSADKKSIIVASSTLFSMNGDNMEMKSSESWKLEGDKTLRIDAVNGTPDGDMKTSAVYDKK
jgi:hypothetical protein